MADPILLTNVSQSDYDTAEATLISLVRAAYPSLDLRRGTVLRDILIRPAASIYALNTTRLADLQKQMSLVTLEADPTVDPSYVDALLANFSVVRSTGNKAAGYLAVYVDGDRIYTIAPGTRFVTTAGLGFVTTQSYTVRTNPESGDLPLYKATADSSYYFVLPIVAEDVGSQYNLSQGVRMDPVSLIYGFVTAETFSSLTAGVAAETIDQVIARLPAAVSYKALESRTSISAKLQTAFEGTATTFQAISVQGYGDSAQLRDKHNPMGFAVGSRVDIYARTFATPSIVVLTKSGRLIAPNTYQVQLAREDVPGYYAIRSVSELEMNLNVAVTGLPVLGSYAFTEVRSASGLTDTFHDIDPANAMIEACNTVYQTATITITGVPQTTETHEFKIEVYSAPGLRAIQDFVDDPAVRNVEADYLIRCPFVCLVNVDAKVYYNRRLPPDMSKMQQDIYNYINTRSFVPRLTRSELACIMHSDGATRVDMGTSGLLLSGIVRDATGVLHTLQGDSLELAQLEIPERMLTRQTIVFGADINSIHLEAIGE